MSVFKLQKWYFDILVPEYFFIFGYFGQIKLFGFSEYVFHIFKTSFSYNKTISRTYKFKPKTDNPSFDKNTIRLNALEIDTNGQNSVIKITTDDVDIDLRYLSTVSFDEAGHELIIPANKNHQIVWYPVHLKSTVYGHVKIGADNTQLENANGYSDQLNSNVFPLKAPVHRLYWGRIHHDQLDIVYTITSSKNDTRQWNILIIRLSGKIIQFTQPKITLHGSTNSEKLSLEYPQTILLEAQNKSLTIKIAIHQGIMITESGFVEQQESESPFKTRILRHISKDPRGIKFFSKADIEVEFNNHNERLTQIPCISEVVAFN